MSEVIRDMLERECGATVDELMDEVPGIGRRAMSKRLQRMMASSLAFHARMPETLAYRWFLIEAHRDAWAAANPVRQSVRSIRKHGCIGRPPTQCDRLLQFVRDCGGNGCLPSDIAQNLPKEYTKIGWWITQMAKRKLVDTLMHRGIRAIKASEFEWGRGALNLLTQRIDKSIIDRANKIAQTRKNKAIPMRPGVDAGVVIRDRSVSFKNAAADYSRARIVECVSPKYVAPWQMLPDSGESIFADRPRYGSGS